MSSSRRTNWTVIAVSCFLTIVVVLIVLWPFHELIGFIVVGLGVLAVVVALALWVIRTVTDVKGNLNEQGLRRGRLRPNDDGYYEIPLDGEEKGQVLPPRSDQRWEREKSYYQGYNPKDVHDREWIDPDALG